MAVFDQDARSTHHLDYRLMAGSPVTLFWHQAILNEAIDWLVAHGYQVVRLDASGWLEEGDLHRDFASALGFPAHYGGSLVALGDCLGDVAVCDYGVKPEATGLVLVLIGYDRFAVRFSEVAEMVLDIIACNSWTAMLMGHRMFCLVQSDDPRIVFGPLGGAYARWNDREWREDRRGLRRPPASST
ncbi:barstar family protein [Streptosporangium sp. NPDC000095]|uniref:barstar family protein n=1 Tax=Streptosporangium sp. NPDC000095 TaxID=3366184 RepID=UPI0036BD344C